MNIKELIHYLNYSGQDTSPRVVFKTPDGKIYPIRSLIVKAVEDQDENIYKALVLES